MIVEIIVYDGEYPNGSSWKYGFSSVDDAVSFLQKDKEHLQTLCGLTQRGADCSHEWDTDEIGVFCIRCGEREQ